MDHGRRSLQPVAYGSAPASELIERYSAAGLKLIADLDSLSAAQPLVERLLAGFLEAAHRNDIADVQFSALAAGGRIEIRAAARTIDRAVAIEFARALDLLKLREAIEASGGSINRAASRFAIFQLEVSLPY